MKLPRILLLNILFLLILSSCKKDITSPVFAGVYNYTMLFHEFNQPLQIQFQTDTLKNILYGIDSIDIDFDGSFDIFISQRIYLDWKDDFNRSYLEKDNFPFIGLRLKNGFEVAYKWIEVNVGQGYFNSISLVDALTYETRVDKIENWCDSSVSSYFGSQNGQIWLWGAPPSLFWTYGTWYGLTNTKTYIGIRKKTNTEHKLGWIKVKVYSKERFEIMSYAIEK